MRCGAVGPPVEFEFQSRRGRVDHTCGYANGDRGVVEEAAGRLPC